VKIADCSAKELLDRLHKDGLNLRIGPFTINLKTELEILVHPLHSLYADFVLARDCYFPDFYIQMAKPATLRRWWHPQVTFRLHGISPFNPFPLRLAFPLLEWGMNWCIANHAHQYLMIHSAVLEREGHTLLFIAPPGSGKSTLAAAMCFRGWRLYSDELALVRPADGHLVPVPRPIGLKNQSIELIRNYAPEAVFSAVWPESHKGAVAHVKPPDDCVHRSLETSMPGSILFMSYSVDSPTELKPFPKSRAFLRIAESSFNYSLLGRTGFETMAGMIDRCDCYEFVYSDLDDAVGQLSRLGKSRV
jgi:HprK-related kinase A